MPGVNVTASTGASTGANIPNTPNAIAYCPNSRTVPFRVTQPNRARTGQGVQEVDTRLAMSLLLLPFQLVLLMFAGWVNRHQLDVIEYLQEESRILRERLGGRHSFHQRRGGCSPSKRRGLRLLARPRLCREGERSLATTLCLVKLCLCQHQALLRHLRLALRRNFMFVSPCRRRAQRTRAGEIVRARFLSSLATRTCPHAGRSSSSSTTGAQRPHQFGSSDWHAAEIAPTAPAHFRYRYWSVCLRIQKPTTKLSLHSRVQQWLASCFRSLARQNRDVGSAGAPE